MLVMFASCAAVLGVVALNGMFLVWWERKISAHIQSRVGPMTTGYWHGWLQSIADGVKLLLKENIIPLMADRWLFMLAPLVVFMSAFMAFVPIPWGEKLIVADLNVGVLYIAAITSLSAIGVIMAGWASNNKWSLYGGMRAAAQIVSYEIPVGLALVPALLASSTLSMQGIVEVQAGGIWNWNIFAGGPFTIVAFGALFLASLAEVNRAPFDLPEAESELVCGFHTEYSGMCFAFFFLAEYSEMFVVAVVASVLYLGGWHDPLGLGILPGPVVLMAKVLLLVFVQMWFRWTFPRLRVDQLMYLAWKVLTPLGFINVFGAAFWLILV
ncbi:MAG: NADH-quinone oxidoreductase subunit NuoH [Gemmatimonadetes bacterium]|nr:NADH-quinone oxidoreductase subunit NuoH [Gemmatimonadota bacterium]